MHCESELVTWDCANTRLLPIQARRVICDVTWRVSIVFRRDVNGVQLQNRNLLDVPGTAHREDHRFGSPCYLAERILRGQVPKLRTTALMALLKLTPSFPTMAAECRCGRHVVPLSKSNPKFDADGTK